MLVLKFDKKLEGNGSRNKTTQEQQLVVSGFGITTCLFLLFILYFFFFLKLVPVTVQEHGGVLRRQKRNWILAPRNLDEGQDYTTYDFVARVCISLFCFSANDYQNANL